MSAIPDLIDQIAPIAIGALLNGLWQGVAVTILVWCVLRTPRQINATTRYTIWLATLFVVIALPLLSVQSIRDSSPQAKSIALGEPFAEQNTTPAARSTELSEEVSEIPLLTVEGENHIEDVASESDPSLRPETARAEGGTGVIETPKIPRTAIFSLPIELLPGNWSMVLLCIWLLVAAVMIARLGWSFAHLQRLRREAVPLAPQYQRQLQRCLITTNNKRRVNLLASSEISMPMAVGLTSPTVLVPAPLVEQLTETEFEHVLLHELAHLGRWDDWTNLGQKLMAAVFFFHPAVLWIGRQLTFEREMAADDRVLSVTGQTRSYAACLTRLIELNRMPRREALAPSAVQSKNQLISRVEYILNKKRNSTLRVSRTWLTAATGVLVVFAIICLQVSPIIAVPGKIAPSEKRDFAETIVEPTQRIELIPSDEVDQVLKADQMSRAVEQRRITEGDLRLSDEQMRVADEMLGEADRRMRAADQKLRTEGDERSVAEEQKSASRDQLIAGEEQRRAAEKQKMIAEKQGRLMEEEKKRGKEDRKHLLEEKRRKVEEAKRGLSEMKAAAKKSLTQEEELIGPVKEKMSREVLPKRVANDGFEAAYGKMHEAYVRMRLATEKRLAAERALQAAANKMSQEDINRQRQRTEQLMREAQQTMREAEQLRREAEQLRRAAEKYHLLMLGAPKKERLPKPGRKSWGETKPRFSEERKSHPSPQPKQE